MVTKFTNKKELLDYLDKLEEGVQYNYELHLNQVVIYDGSDNYGYNLDTLDCHTFTNINF